MMTALRARLSVIFCLLSGPVFAASLNPTGQLTLSSNTRYLLEDGRPFFWVGDTAWALALSLTRSDATTYLDDTAGRGFNVIQMFTDARWALGSGNRTKMGYPVYDNKDPRQLNRNHFNHVGWVIDQASSRGIYTVLCVGGPAIKAEYKENAPQYYNLLDTNAKRYTYGRKLGQFFRSRNDKIIWCLSQDEPFRSDPFKAGWDAMAEGIADGVNGSTSDNFNGRANYATTLMTFHGTSSTQNNASGYSQSELRNLPWLDLYATYANNKLLHDTALFNYGLSPKKPAFEMETRYESRTNKFSSWNSWWRARTDVYGGGSNYIDGPETRAHIYQSYQAGHMGYTYGHDEIYKYTSNWKSALSANGRRSMARAKAFYESIPWTKLTPDQSLITDGSANSGLWRIAAAYTTDGQYETVYFPVGNVSRTIQFSRISSSHDNVEARWFNPSTGAYTTIGTFPRTANRKSFISPRNWTGAMLLLKGVNTQDVPVKPSGLTVRILRGK